VIKTIPLVLSWILHVKPVFLLSWLNAAIAFTLAAHPVAVGLGVGLAVASTVMLVLAAALAVPLGLAVALAADMTESCFLVFLAQPLLCATHLFLLRMEHWATAPPACLQGRYVSQFAMLGIECLARQAVLEGT
jgi:hypothetical protein